MEDLTALVRELATIPRHEDETAAGDAIAAWLREHTDATVERDDAPGGGNVIARKGSGRRSLALVGHHDVVPPDDSQVHQDSYRVEERDGRLYGRGTADMTGAVAASMFAFRDATPSAELIFASFVGEEVGGVGARYAIDRGFEPDCAIVGEGTTGYSGAGVTDVAIAHKGRRGSRIVARGETAHASEPDAGENAIYRACDAVDVVRGLDALAVEIAGERVVGSLAVTEIEGGTAWNVVPDACEATIDERTVPGKRAPIERVEEIDGVELIVDQDLPPMECSDDAFAELVLDAAAAAQSERPEFVVKPHATDAGWLAEAGTECVICGPAELGEAHTATESVSLDGIERCYRIYHRSGETFPSE